MFKKLIILCLAMLMTIPVFAQLEEEYTVQPGDSIQAIANVFGVTADAILRRNQIIDASSLRSGEVLIIPVTDTFIPESHTVKPGETLNDIAIRYETSVQELQVENQIATGNIAVGQDIMLPNATGGTGGATGQINFPVSYIVDTGDTLRSIAEEFGTTWQALAAANNIPNPNYVQAGLVITIPDPNAAPVTTTTAAAQQAASNQTYIVQAGDNAGAIAARFNVTIESLLILNSLQNSSTLQPGDVLLIPPTGGAVTQQVVVTQPVPLPRQTVNGVYTVQAGDNMFAVATSFNTSIYTIAQANGLLNLNNIFIGQQLAIPGR